MEQEISKLPAWRLEAEAGRPLNLESGDEVILTFQNEGENYEPENPKYKKAVVFEVLPVEFPVVKKLYVRSNELKRQISALGFPLKGKAAKLSREGEGLATKWKLEAIE